MKRQGSIICIFHIIVIFLLSMDIASAEVHIDYPGLNLLWMDEDYNLPGTPSTDKNQYADTLHSWCRLYGYPISREAAQALVDKKMDAGLSQSPTFSYMDGGSTKTGQYYDTAQPIWHVMREIIFLRTLQNSVRHWEKNYIDPLSIEAVSKRDAYNRAEDIREAFEDYLNGGLFNNDEHNPFVTGIVAGAMTDYAGAFDGNGQLQSRFNSSVKLAIENSAAKVWNGTSFVEEFTTTGTVVGAGAGFIVDYLHNQGEHETATMVDLVTTEGLAAVSGGFSAVLAPAKMFYSVMSEIGIGFLDSSRGTHLILHYYLANNYADSFLSSGLFTPSGAIDFTEVQADLSRKLGGNTLNDPMINYFQNTLNYSFSDTATTEQAKGVYAMSSMMMLAGSLNIANMEKNLAAFAYLQSLKDYGFILNFFRIQNPHNKFTISIPDEMRSDSEHGGNLASVTWHWAEKSSSSYSNLMGGAYDAAITRQVQDLGQLVELDLNLEVVSALDKDIKIKVSITYPDGFTRLAYADLDWLPQHNNASWLLNDTKVIVGNYAPGDLIVDGDLPENIWVCWRNNKKKVNLDKWEDSEGVIHYGIKVFIDQDEAVGPDVPFWIDVDGAISNIVQRDIVNEDDTDADSLLDAWEREFFGDLSPEGNQDPDGDGKSNFVEMNKGTDPAKTGGRRNS
ncbi:MAG: hypothetical protein BBJ57_03910 [Desulfobacterales bacterium PC51MH44]|nr:MAG: hypothetical protein BBJ57_03910 [Desulfobacterales bacterium PC51MH44]